jgi:hypothetical protein
MQRLTSTQATAHADLLHDCAIPLKLTFPRRAKRMLGNKRQQGIRALLRLELLTKLS